MRRWFLRAEVSDVDFSAPNMAASVPILLRSPLLPIVADLTDAVVGCVPLLCVVVVYTAWPNTVVVSSTWQLLLRRRCLYGLAEYCCCCVVYFVYLAAAIVSPLLCVIFVYGLVEYSVSSTWQLSLSRPILCRRCLYGHGQILLLLCVVYLAAVVASSHSASSLSTALPNTVVAVSSTWQLLL
jgi:hypothetical protein